MQAKASNTISWEYWNDKERELCKKDPPEKEGDEDISLEKNNEFSPISFPMEADDVVITPFFPVRKGSYFKPSDRWECWIGNMNFRIDEEFLNFLNLETDGVGCLNVLDPYTFALGVAKLFDFNSVRSQIERKIKGQNEISGSSGE
jgi:hypothetical protein